MHHKFLLLLGLCVLATALPRDKRSAESSSSSSESDESREVKSSTSAKPLESDESREVRSSTSAKPLESNESREAKSRTSAKPLESDESREVEPTTTAKPLPSKIIAIKDAADLDTRITQAGDKVVIIFYMTTWCPFCRKVTPKIEDIAAKTENLIVVKVDRDHLGEDEAAWNYGLKELPSVPRFYFIKDGKLVTQIVGSNADIRGTLSKVMSSNESNSSDSSDE